MIFESQCWTKIAVNCWRWLHLSPVTSKFLTSARATCVFDLANKHACLEYGSKMHRSNVWTARTVHAGDKTILYTRINQFIQIPRIHPRSRQRQSILISINRYFAARVSRMTAVMCTMTILLYLFTTLQLGFKPDLHHIMMWSVLCWSSDDCSKPSYNTLV